MGNKSFKTSFEPGISPVELRNNVVYLIASSRMAIMQCVVTDRRCEQSEGGDANRMNDSCLDSGVKQTGRYCYSHFVPSPSVDIRNVLVEIPIHLVGKPDYNYCSIARGSVGG